MSYKLDDLYEAIRHSGRVIGPFKIADDREYGSGSVYFTSEVGSIRQVYASPHWELGFGFEMTIYGPTQSHIALQVEGFDEATGEYTGPVDHLNLEGFVLTGDLGDDVTSYFNLMETYLNSLV